VALAQLKQLPTGELKLEKIHLSKRSSSAASCTIPAEEVRGTVDASCELWGRWLLKIRLEEVNKRNI